MPSNMHCRRIDSALSARSSIPRRSGVLIFRTSALKNRARLSVVLDNVFIERLWRSLKHEDIYLKGYADGCEAKAGIANWIAFYNDRRLHQALGYRAPMAVWRERMQAAKAVDMMDNADALTTCPQQQQQQTESLAA